MIPLVVNKGDVICFDTSIIHASSMNKTSEDRISLAGALLPKNHSKVEYLLKDKKFIKYDIDNDYWLDGGKVSTLRNYKHTTGDYNFINPVSKNDIENLLKI
jgi:ectoine hydroxylase-related dioxygenase (phytanoyl-CoA dioxygenase family)